MGRGARRIDGGTLFLIGIDDAARALYTASRMDNASSSTVAGRAAWRRQRRLAYYLWQSISEPAAPPPPPMKLLAQLDDIADEPFGALPKLCSNGGPAAGVQGAERCGLKLAVPIPLKGLGSTDLEHRLHSLSRGGRRPPSEQAVEQALQPWEQRRPMGVWRGSSRSVLPSEACLRTPMGRWEQHPRGRLVALARRHPDLIDAGYSELETRVGAAAVAASSSSAASSTGDDGGATATTTATVAARIPWANLSSFKYQIEVDGHGYQASLAAKLLTGSTVLVQQSAWMLWFADSLRDREHVVAIRHDLSDLPAQIEWLRANDAEAKAIAARGAARMRELLQEQSMRSHVAQLLCTYRRALEPHDAPPPLGPLPLCAAVSRRRSRVRHSRRRRAAATLLLRDETERQHKGRGRGPHARPRPRRRRRPPSRAARAAIAATARREGATVGAAPRRGAITARGASVQRVSGVLDREQCLGATRYFICGGGGEPPRDLHVVHSFLRTIGVADVGPSAVHYHATLPPSSLRDTAPGT